MTAVQSIRHSRIHGRAGALLDRQLVGADIALIDHDGAQDRLLGHRLLAKKADRQLRMNEGHLSERVPA